MARTRTQSCGEPQALQRLSRAKSFLEVATLTADENDPALEFGAAAASIAILAGIAAADAACCFALGYRSRSQDHRDAEQLLARIEPGGKRAASSLRQLIGLKDSAHYGFVSVNAAELKRALRQADRLVAFAEEVLTR